MKFFIAIGCLMVIIILCDKYQHRLPPPIKWLYAGWLKFSHVLGQVMSTIILTILWIVGIGSYALVFKVMHLFTTTSTTDSYWLTAEEHSTKQMQHQF